MSSSDLKKAEGPTIIFRENLVEFIFNLKTYKDYVGELGFQFANMHELIRIDAKNPERQHTKEIARVQQWVVPALAVELSKPWIHDYIKIADNILAELPQVPEQVFYQTRLRLALDEEKSNLQVHIREINRLLDQRPVMKFRPR